MPADVSDLAQVEALADAAFDAFETVDLVFNNAGEGGVRGKLWEVEARQGTRAFRREFLGHLAWLPRFCAAPDRAGNA